MQTDKKGRREPLFGAKSFVLLVVPQVGIMLP